MPATLRSTLTFTLLLSMSVLSNAEADDFLCPRGKSGLRFRQRYSSQLAASRKAQRQLTLDKNGDGLPDCLERALGLKRLSRRNVERGLDQKDGQRIRLLSDYNKGLLDSDGDLLSDSSELAGQATDPYLTDTHGVGTYDTLENIAATLPTTTDDEYGDDDDEDEDDRHEEDEDEGEDEDERPRICRGSPHSSVRHTRLTKYQLRSRSQINRRCPLVPPPSPTSTPTTRPPGVSTPIPGGAQPTPAPTPLVGNASKGRAFYSTQKHCNVCHGKKQGRSAAQVARAMRLSVHANVRRAVTPQVLLNIAAYLNSKLP